MSAAKSGWRGTKALSALGVVAAMVVAVNVNVLVARFYTRWDVTSEGLYTLSPATVGILRSLDAPVRVTVLLAKSDPLLAPMRQTLVAYGAETRKLEVSYLDPEQNPAEFVAVQKKHGIMAGQAEDGRVVTDAVVLVASGERTWFVTSEELSSFDDEGRARPRIEQALSEGIANVTRGESAKLCFSTGHGEASLDDVGPEGLAELRRRVEKSNYEALAVDLGRSDAEKTLAGCRVLVVAGPELAFGADAAGRVERFAQKGGGIVLFAGPVFTEDARVRPSGLEAVAERFGIRLASAMVLETDASLRLPRGAGETFAATPLEHAVTRGLVREGGKVDFPVVVSESRALELVSGGPARRLLASSAEAVVLENLEVVLGGKGPPPDARRAERLLAAASELPKAAGSPEKYGQRAVIFGSRSLPWTRSFRDPALLGARLLVENALAWTAARPAIVSVPEKPARAVGLALTEESMGEILRYVLVYMPSTAALAGFVLLFRRRARETRSRRGNAGGAT
ncbi:MAG TPA: GldG family protein [Polyangiaceae bacterium]